MFSPRKEDLKDLAFWTSVQCNSTKSVKIGATVNKMRYSEQKLIIFGPKVQ
jgi:hypothetical protein